MKKLLTFASLVLAGFIVEAAAEVVEYDNFKNSEWNLSEQYVNNRFDACVARKLKDDDGHGFSIGRPVSGATWRVEPPCPWRVSVPPVQAARSRPRVLRIRNAATRRSRQRRGSC